MKVEVLDLLSECSYKDLLSECSYNLNYFNVKVVSSHPAKLKCQINIVFIKKVII